MDHKEIAPLSVDEFLRHDYDFLVVGGGTAGLAVAGRLAESGKYSIGLLEAGGHASGENNIDIPAFYGRSLGGQHDWQFETEPQPGLGGRRLPWPRGKVLGGTSALNFMTWNRASRDDYDAWEALGNTGWGWDNFLPFFKKSETFHGPGEQIRSQYEVSHDPRSFGTSGPIQVSYSPEYSGSHALWHDTLNSLGVSTNKNHVNGSNVGPWTNVNAVDPSSQTRCYSTSYVSRIPGASKLRILCGATVDKLSLKQDGDRTIATGAHFTIDGQQHHASVSKEVVLSCGSIQSPQLLELSGIGDKKVLDKAGVQTVVHSPNVGENLQEHLMLAFIFEVDPSLDNPDDLKTDAVAAKAAQEQYDRDRSGRNTILPNAICYLPLTKILSGEALSALHEKAGRVTSTSTEKKQILENRLDGTANVGQIEYIFDLGNWNPYFTGSEGKKYATLLQILQHPFTVGSIHIKPGSTRPAIDPRYYEGEHGKIDFEVMKQSTSFAKRLVKTEPLSKIVRGPAYPPASALDDENNLQDWIVQNTITDWHPVGTCAMGGKAGIDEGVVDERLKVYGVQGLRVIDASIMPLQISSHPQATIYAIAEKGAAMILEDHA